MFKIGLDSLGGDFGDKPIVDALKKYLTNFKDDEIQFIVYGDEKSIIDKLNSFDKNTLSKITVIQTNDYIDLNKNILTEFKRKGTTINLAMQDLISKDETKSIDAFISQGSSAALRILANFVGRIKGVKECPFAALVPTLNKNVLLLDSGANVDVNANDINSFANIGSVYMSLMYDIKKPTVGLLNNGIEEEKGNKITREAYQLLKNNTEISFYGNVEFRDFPLGLCDICVCDGFVGNCTLKTYEGSAKMLLSVIKEVITSSTKNKVAALMIKDDLKNTLIKFNAKSYGGAPILGCKKLIVKCHGNAEEQEIYNSILQVKQYLKTNITQRIEDVFNNKQ